VVTWKVSADCINASSPLRSTAASTSGHTLARWTNTRTHISHILQHTQHREHTDHLPASMAGGLPPLYPPSLLATANATFTSPTYSELFPPPTLLFVPSALGSATVAATIAAAITTAAAIAASVASAPATTFTAAFPAIGGW
jgi:hypothetical protein